MESIIAIGEILRYYRCQKELSQEQLAEGICDRKYISNIELGKQIPTLDIINQLSLKLGINLYETYALMLRHHDIDTHKKIELLNQHFNHKNIPKLGDLISQYETLPAFSYGEPFLHLQYAKALYTAWSRQQYQEAIDIALKAFSEYKPFDINNTLEYRLFSNIELNLIKLIAINYCRIDNKAEGKKYFDFLYKYIRLLFNQSHYATNRNNRFELHFSSNLVYNYFLFFKDEADFEYKIIDETLALLKSLHSNYMLCELLLCKTYLQISSNDATSAQSTYQLAHALGLYLYEEDYQEHIERTILGNFYSFF